MTAGRRHGLAMIELLVVMGIISLLLSLILPAVQSAREVARRTDCVNRMKQNALALHIFHDSHRHLPSGTETDTFRGWPSLILAELGDSAMDNEADVAFQSSTSFSKHRLFREHQPQFVCPSDVRSASPGFVESHKFVAAFLSYLGNSGLHHFSRDGVLYADSKIQFRDVTDGLSNTLMLAERPPTPDLRFGWWYGGVGQSRTGSLDHHLGVAEINRYYPECPTANPFEPFWTGNVCSGFRFWSYHSAAFNVARCDGSVGSLSFHIDRAVLESVGTRNGGEVE